MADNHVQKSFEKAKQRYKESNDHEDSNIIDFSKFQNVEPVSTLSPQIFNSINNNTKLTAGYLQEIEDNTLKLAKLQQNGSQEIVEGVGRLSKDFLKSHKPLTDILNRDLAENQKSKGWITRAVEGLGNFFSGKKQGVASHTEVIAATSLLMYKQQKQMTDYLASIKDNIRYDNDNKKDTDKARELTRGVNSQGKSKIFSAFDGLLEYISPGIAKNVELTTKTIKSTNQFFKHTGENSAKKLIPVIKNFSKSSGISSLLNLIGSLFLFQKTLSILGKFGSKIGLFSSNFLKLAGGNRLVGFTKNIGSFTRVATILPRFFSIFGLLAGSITAILGSAVFATVYSLFKNPELLMEYFEVFSEIFVLMKDAFVWFSKEILPPLTVAFMALVYVGEKFLDKFGYIINKVIIFTLRQIVKFLRHIGKAIVILWDFWKETFLRILGMFGYGKYKDGGLLDNVIGIFKAMGNLLKEAFVWILDFLGDMINFGNWLNLEEGETFTNKIGEIIFSAIDSVVEYFKGIGNKINETILEWGGIFVEYAEKYNPVNLIKNAFLSMVDSILAWIPTSEDIVAWAYEMTPWYLKKLIFGSGHEKIQQYIDDKEAKSTFKNIEGHFQPDTDKTNSLILEKKSSEIQQKIPQLTIINENNVVNAPQNNVSKNSQTIISKGKTTPSFGNFPNISVYGTGGLTFR